jgi:hypothetical protein
MSCIEAKLIVPQQATGHCQKEETKERKQTNRKLNSRPTHAKNPALQSRQLENNAMQSSFMLS